MALHKELLSDRKLNEHRYRSLNTALERLAEEQRAAREAADRDREDTRVALLGIQVTLGRIEKILAQRSKA